MKIKLNPKLQTILAKAGAAEVDDAAIQRQIEAERKRDHMAIAKENAQRRHVIQAERLRQAHIPPRFHDRTLDTWKPINATAAQHLETAINFAKSFEAGTESHGQGLLMLGNPGTGKTHLAVAIARYLQEQDFSVAYFTASELTDKIKSAYSNNTNQDEVINQLTDDIDLLLIDELGDQSRDRQGRVTEYEQMLTFRIVDSRYRYNKSTIAISNYSAKTLADQLGEKVIDRFRETSNLLTFNWESQRGR